MLVEHDELLAICLLGAWNKVPNIFSQNAGEFNCDESLHGIESIKLGQSSLNSLLRFKTMLGLTVVPPLVIPPGKDRWCSPLPLVLVDIRAPKTEIATFWGVAIAILLSLWRKSRKNGGFWPSQKSSVKKLDRSLSWHDWLLQVPGSEEENFWRIWCMIIPVGTGDFTSPTSSKLVVYQKSTVVTTCLFWQLKMCWKSHPKENSSLRFLEPFQLFDFSDVKNPPKA